MVTRNSASLVVRLIFVADMIDNWLAVKFIMSEMKTRGHRASTCLSTEDKMIENLVTFSSRTKTYGEWTFAVAASALWKAVPIDIRNSATVAQFKARAKTNLFKVAFLV